MQDSNQIREQWKLGRVSKIYPGKDGKVRKVSCSAFGLLNRAAVGWAVSCFAFGLFFLNRAAVGWAVSCFAFGLLFFFCSFVGDYIQTSADDVIISQLQAISQLFSSYPPSGEFC